VAGLDVTRDWQRIKPLFGYVPDRDNHFTEFSGKRNLQLFAGLYGVDASRVDECLAQFELSEAAHVPVQAYSLGMRRKLLLARALLHEPRLLYLDEPTTNLDVHSVHLVHGTLRRLAQNGVAVLWTTHNVMEAAVLCDRVAILQRGRLIALDTPAALCPHAPPLADHVVNGEVATLNSREPDFRDAFLRLMETKAP
jgi:ABC-type multidrug transport system ATPase subunit